MTEYNCPLNDALKIYDSVKNEVKKYDLPPREVRDKLEYAKSTLLSCCRQIGLKDEDITKLL